MSTDRIDIKGIHGFGHHGVFEFEKNDGQDFYVDIALHLDLQRASTSDSLSDTIDYGAISTIAKEEIEGPAVDLIERLAGRIADRIKSNFPTISSLAVTVHKPQAPVKETVADISVTITR
jgi:dihydroneopterin aldolase